MAKTIEGYQVYQQQQATKLTVVGNYWQIIANRKK